MSDLDSFFAWATQQRGAITTKGGPGSGRYPAGSGEGDAGKAADPSFDEVYGDPASWKPREAGRHGSGMLREMGFDAGDSGDGIVSISTNKTGFNKLSSTFDKVTLAKKTQSPASGERYHTMINFSNKKNKALVGDYLKEQYASQWGSENED